MVSAAWLATATACLISIPTAAQAPAATLDAGVLRLQVLLDRLGFAPGIIDGRRGMSLTKALKGYQEAKGLRVTGQPDAGTLRALAPYAKLPGTIGVKLTRFDLAGPFVGRLPSEAEDQARLPTMGYANLIEKLAERYHTSPATLIALNSPTTRLAVGAPIRVPNVIAARRDYPEKLKPEWRATLAMLNVDAAQPAAARIVVDKSDGVLRVYGAGDKLVAQFPATMGSENDPLPLGRWTIQGTAYLPPFHYNPKLFWDADSDDTKQLLKPGPNSPVGVVWMDLDKKHYGIHGTATPATIGRTESHGCIRLANWDAARLALMVKPGTPALFQA